MKHMPENKKCGGASMRGQFENSLGMVSIDSEVVATYAGSVAVECFGIVGMAAVNMKDGLVKLLKKDYLHHGISVKIEENNRITLDFHVIVSYGVSISTLFIFRHMLHTVYKGETPSFIHAFLPIFSYMTYYTHFFTKKE